MKMNLVGVMLKEQENKLFSQKNQKHLILHNLINLNHLIKTIRSGNKTMKIIKIKMSFNLRIMKTLETAKLISQNRNQLNLIFIPIKNKQ